MSRRTTGTSFVTRSGACAYVDTLTQIPLLDVHNVDALLERAQSPEGRRNGVLVRWRCMVQDTGVGTVADAAGL